MKNIDVHADDYGLTMYGSEKILEEINKGKLDSISVMPNMGCFEEARELFFRNTDKDKMPLISVHLNFMEGYCVAPKSELGFLVDEAGLFNISWGSLVKYNYSISKRNKVKKQLKKEIKAQIERTAEAYQLLENGKKLRVDSHQHTHMIPIVMESLLEVLSQEKIPVEYIRISKEPWSVYMKKLHLFPTYRMINLIKVMVLNWYARENGRMLKDAGIPTMLLSGVFLSGRMDGERVGILLPDLITYARKKQLPLEVLFHPGAALEEEMGMEFNHADANKFYLSADRQTEYEAVMGLDL